MTPNKNGAAPSDIAAEIEDAQRLTQDVQQLTGPQTYRDDEDDSVVEGAWTIQTIQELEWALSRAAALRREKRDISDASSEAKRRIDARRDSLLSRIERGIAFFEGQIARYADSKRNEILGGSNRKSRTLLNGVVGWRKRPGRLVVTDPEALNAWLTAQPDVTLYRVKVEPEMRVLQERYTETGEIPPGMEYQTEPEKFYVEPLDLKLAR